MRTVYFGTSREPIGSPNILTFGANANPKGALTYGKVDVVDASQHANLHQPVTLQALSVGTFWPDTQSEIVRSSAQHLLISIHGFDYTFGETIVRTAQLGDWFQSGPFGKPTAILCMPWPSLGNLSVDSYGQDYQRATGAGDAFRQFLRTLVPLIAAFRATRPGRRVTLMAHSMGNHVLRAGLQSALGTQPGQYNPAGQPPLFDTIILAASDEDVDALSRTDKLAKVAVLARSVGVYYNNQDIPLTTISHAVNHIARLGVDGPPDKTSFKDPPFVFVNCSVASPVDAHDTPLDPQRHQYYRLVPEVRDDICGLMNGLADDKFLNRIYRPQANYFRLNLASPNS